MTWNAPEGRFFDTGLDRGVLYPKGTPPLGPIAFTNYALDPSIEAGITLWAAAGGTPAVLTHDAVDFVTGTKSLKVTFNGAAVQQGAYLTPVVHSELTAGQAFGAQLTFKAPAGMLLEMYAISQGAGQIEVIKNLVATGDWQTETVIGGVLGDTKNPYVILRTRGAAVAGVINIDNVVIFTGNKIPPYFSGATPQDGYYTYHWVGAINASKSIARERLTLSVPWTGLSSVDEEGGDGASAYYVDGRPFLFLPKPKEYKATLKAYTYPDEFSDIMGVTEVADGMYLDSQPGKAFDLSYRTLVGNATEGVDHGYKIHLVYNATVTPQALTYESLSNSINPTTFSWEIQAVPVRVEGFRPTAHIVIDTRHMDQKKINAIEALLYGSDEEVPHLPSPQVIFDLLSFGDTIIVTDNGDGTFDVTGSYENVYMVGPGVFRVDNVDGQDNGDGTFTISTTIE
jgi:hypothetical protein